MDWQRVYRVHDEEISSVLHYTMLGPLPPSMLLCAPTISRSTEIVDILFYFLWIVQLRWQVGHSNSRGVRANINLSDRIRCLCGDFVRDSLINFRAECFVHVLWLIPILPSLRKELLTQCMLVFSSQQIFFEQRQFVVRRINAKYCTL